ncbi:carboxylesterase [Nostoc sp. 3335mG]|nr:carboxylesterase [Nostoc sp. 3335mG]
MDIEGDVRPGFEAVAAAFARGFAGRPRMGAALHIRHRGQMVVDLWGGVADARSGRRWAADTLSVSFSCSKGLMSILVAMLVEAGQLSYEARVADYWPEFAASGKQWVTVGELMSHRAGLSALRNPVTRDGLFDWSTMTGLLAAEEPLWPPGEGHQYHALTHGWLAGELVRRATSLPVGEAFSRLVTRPLGVEAFIGLPAPLDGRVGHLEVSPGLRQQWASLSDLPQPNWALRALTLGDALPEGLVTEKGGFNDRELWHAQIPGAGAIASARALSTIWSATVAGEGAEMLLGDTVIARSTVPRSEGPMVFGAVPPFHRWGAGFQLSSEARPLLSEKSFGHDGAGGQLGFADPKHEIGFGYLTNWLMDRSDDRADAIVRALAAALADF